MPVARIATRSSRASLWGLGFTVLLSLSADPRPAAAEEKENGRYLPAGDEQPLRQYRAYRRMHAQSEKFGQEAWMEAWTELDEGGFRYTIVSESGSDYIRGKVLKAVLKREQELIKAGAGSQSELSSDNYHFEEASGGDSERYVTMKPKRKDVLLVDGRMVLSRDRGELLRVEGRLSKSPSFWTSLVNVIRHYGRLDGVRVPLATESVARVKLVGVSHLEVRYEYETINGRRVSAGARAAAVPQGASR